MGLITKIKELFSEDESIQKTEAETIDVKFVDVKTVDGMILRVSDLAVDATVVEINESGEVPVSDGEYTLEDGTMISVAGGLITGITPVSVSEQMANVMRTDGVAIYYDGTDLVVGETKLFLDEALTEPAPDGEHLLEGGIKVTVTNGVLTEMVFNLGKTGLSEFKNFLAHIKQRDFDAASEEMLRSAWAKQVGDRAKTLAAVIKSA
jgi:GH24 family phage-related lysozyme (muramidase)